MVLDMSRTMLNTANLPYTLWAEAINTATHIRNRCTTRSLDRATTTEGKCEDNITPEELWSGKKPDITYMKIFRCDAYALEKGGNRSKFDERATKCTLIGYERRGYRLWDSQRGRLIISRDVRFNEQRQHEREETVEITSSYFPKTTTEKHPIRPTSPISMENEEQSEHDDEDISEQQRPTTPRKTRIRKEAESNLGKYWNPPTGS